MVFPKYALASFCHFLSEIRWDMGADGVGPLIAFLVLPIAMTLDRLFR